MKDEVLVIVTVSFGCCCGDCVDSEEIVRMW